MRYRQNESNAGREACRSNDIDGFHDPDPFSPREPHTLRNKRPAVTIRHREIGCGAAKHNISGLDGNRRACKPECPLLPEPLQPV
jgi:hypothetical protein